MKVYAFINESSQPGQEEINSNNIFQSVVGYYAAGGSPYPERGVDSYLSRILDPDDPAGLPDPIHMYSADVPGAGTYPAYDPLAFQHDFRLHTCII
ncbi:hypothetical protein O3S80_25200 [Streptomyces sp. Lzd4kr]|nr:hypothetical protein [Streptomyces sp. Lzd4kr]